MPEYTPMIKQYLDVKKKHAQCILFFQLGDFYEMFFEDAITASKVLGIALTGRDAGQTERIPMCGIPIHAVNNYLPKLITAGYKVAVCEQIQNPQDAKGVVQRAVTRIITPGVNLEEKLLDNKKNHFLLCVSKIAREYAIAVADISTGDYYVFTAAGNNSNINKLINEIIAWHPSEVLLTFLDQELNVKLKDYNLYTTTIDNSLFSEIEDPLHTLSTHFDKNDRRNNLPQDLSSVEQLAASWLLAYVEVTQKNAMSHINRLVKIISKDKMILDNNARRNLELTQTLRNNETWGSLLWVLDETVSAMGARLLRQWIENPLVNLVRINERLEAIETMIKLQSESNMLKSILKDIYDLERLIAKLSASSANARDLNAISKTLKALPRIREIAKSFIGSSLLEQLLKELVDVTKLTDLLDIALLSEPPLSIKEGGMIKKGYNKKLDEYRSVTTDGKEWLLNYEIKQKELTGIKSLKVGYNKVFGYYIEVTKNNINQVPVNYIRKQTLANAERYITDELKKREDDIIKASENLALLEYELFLELKAFTINKTNDIQKIAKALANYDVLLSLAEVAQRENYSKPIFNDIGKIKIIQGRHPVVEKMVTEPYVPNDVYMDDQEQQIQLITGPNMAGKSTYMRQVALIVLLAQVGSYVPAESADLCIFDRIFTRIGASDDLASGQSTFMVEMVEARDALLEATNNSLIILDEIGRGTSTYDGMALAHAIIEYIHEYVRAKTLFSTHYHELTDLEQDYQRIVNYHVECIEKKHKVIFLHQVKRGRADKSYGVYVAQIAGLPVSVTKRAKKLLSYYEKKSNYKENEQLSLLNFVVEEREEQALNEEYKEIFQDIESINITNMTPIEALNYLYQLQQKISK